MGEKMTDQILFFYIIGILFFILGIEGTHDKPPNNYIYIGLSFIINLMGYELSYTDSAFTSAAYFPLILLILTVIIMLYMIFEYLKKELETDFKEDTEED